MASLINLTPELMTCITRFCDGKSLINLGNAHKSWSDFLLFNSKTLNRKWGNICCEEMPHDFILDILQSLHPKHWIGDTNVFWSDVYICWHEWRNSPPFKYELVELLDRCEIYSVAVSGDWVFLGTSRMGLQALNIKTLERRILYKLCTEIMNIQLNCTTNYDENCDMFLAGVDHDQVIFHTSRFTVSFDLNNGKSTIYNHIRQHLDLVHIRFYEGQEVRIVSGINTSSEIFSKNVLSKEVSKKQVDSSISSVLQVWNGRILILYKTGDMQMYDYKLHPIEHPINHIKLDLSDYIHSIVFHSDVLFVLGPLSYFNSWFEIYVNGNVKRYFPFSPISVMITSVLYHAGILFLGTDLGEIFIYVVGSDAELHDLTLDEPFHKLSICSESILTITIQERFSGHPFLIVTTYEKVFLVNFL